MLIQVLHNDRDSNHYEHVANIEAPEHYDVERSLEYAFRRTQNIDGSWSMRQLLDVYDLDGNVEGTIVNHDYDPNITVVKPLRTWSDGREMGHRSSMMYDRMIVGNDIYEVDAFGFRKLDDQHA